MIKRKKGSREEGEPIYRIKREKLKRGRKEGRRKEGKEENSANEYTLYLLYHHPPPLLLQTYSNPKD